jgi:hypothetical protein
MLMNQPMINIPEGALFCREQATLVAADRMRFAAWSLLVETRRVR